jgi:molybdopterin synthase sulfur carrier subunit
MIRILYFMKLGDLAGHTLEEVALPADVRDVQTLIAWLESRGADWQQALAGGSGVQVTVNKQFAEPDTPIVDGNEIALVPRPR